MSRARAERTSNIWPGFVDALATLLLVITFLLVVFILAYFFISQTLSGRDAALERLNRQVNELAELLSLERQANADLRLNVAQLSASLQISTEARETLALRLGGSLARHSSAELTLGIYSKLGRDDERNALDLLPALPTCGPAAPKEVRATGTDPRAESVASSVATCPASQRSSMHSDAQSSPTDGPEKAAGGSEVVEAAGVEPASRVKARSTQHVLRALLPVLLIGHEVPLEERIEGRAHGRTIPPPPESVFGSTARAGYHPAA